MGPIVSPLCSSVKQLSDILQLDVIQGTYSTVSITRTVTLKSMYFVVLNQILTLVTNISHMWSSLSIEVSIGLRTTSWKKIFDFFNLI